jgi:hypothetical protein
MQPLMVAVAASLGVVLCLGRAPDDEQEKVKLSDCPAAVRKTLQAEAKGLNVETLTKENNADGETVYWAEVEIGGKAYMIGVLDEGTLIEMNLAVDEEEVPLTRCPMPVQATFQHEAFGTALESVGKDIKYGVTVYHAAVSHNGRSYEIVVGAEGTLVEKVLVIEDDPVEVAKCPPAVQRALRDHAKGGSIGQVVRSTGIAGPTFEAEVHIKTRIYLIEVAESGSLISKSLEAGEE